jgi:hypothetical protein
VLLGLQPQLLCAELASLDGCDDPELVAAEAAALLAQTARRERAIHSGGLASVAALLRLANDPAAGRAAASVASAVPWWAFRELLSARRGGVSGPSLDPVLEVIARAQQQLGDDTNAWRVLESLMDSFTGTVGELLETAAAVAD